MGERGSDRIIRNISAVLVAALLAVMVSPSDARTESSQKQGKHLPLAREFQPGVSHIPAAAARFSPDGKTLVVLSRKHIKAHDSLVDYLSDTICAWDVRTGKQVWRVDDIGVSRVKFSADGKTIACLESTGTTPETDKWAVRLRDVQTGKLLSRPPIPVDSFNGWAGFALSPDGKTLAVLRDRINLCLLDTMTGKSMMIGKSIMTFDEINTRVGFGNQWDLTFSPNGYLIAARPYDFVWDQNLFSRELIVWQTLNGGFVYLHLYREGGYTDLLSESNPVALDPAFFISNQRLIYSDSTLNLSYNASESQLQPMIPESEMWTGDGYRLFVGFVDQAESTKDQEPHLALFYAKIENNSHIGNVRQLELWDTQTKKRIKVIHEPKNVYFKILDYSPVARLIARCNGDGILTLQQL